MARCIGQSTGFAVDALMKHNEWPLGSSPSCLSLIRADQRRQVLGYGGMGGFLMSGNSLCLSELRSTKSSVVIYLLGVVFASPTFAGFVAISEQEPNDSLLTAQPIPPFAPVPFGVGSVEGTLVPGDVDFYQVQFTTSVQFTATVGDLSGALQTGGDAYLAVFNQQGMLLYFNDDLAPSTGILAGLLSQQLSAGTYIFAVTGEADSAFDGSHSQELSYRLRVEYSPIPVPGMASMAIIAGGLVRTRRRL